MDINERIFTTLKAQGKTQSDLARALDVRDATISEWKRNRTTPSAATCGRVAEYLGVSVDYLVRGKEFISGVLELSQNHIALLLFIRRAEYAGLSTVPADLLGDKDDYSDNYSAVEYLEKCDLIRQVAHVKVPKEKYTSNDRDKYYCVAERGYAYIENHVGGAYGKINQGIFGDRNQNNTITFNGGSGEKLTEFEEELLKVCAGLNMRHKNALLNYAYDLEKQATDKK